MTAPEVSELNPTRCSVKTPQASWSVVNIGKISILFSYGRPAGVDIGAKVYVLPSKRSTVKHLNIWRDFRIQTEVPEPEFTETLLKALDDESSELLSNFFVEHNES